MLDSAMTKSDLTALRAEIDKRLSKTQEKERRKAIKAARRLAKDFDLTQSEIFDPVVSRPYQSINPPIYRNTENSDETWTGKGRRPKWVHAHVEGGGTLDDLLISMAD